MLKWLKQNWLLALIVLLGGLLRFYQLNWDEGHYFHPDERNIANAVAGLNFFSQLNPHFFAYGSLPIYIERLMAELMVGLTGQADWTSDWAKINLLGRFLSALFSTLTLIPVYAIAHKIWTKKAALLASGLTALTVSLIQTAHYGVTESLLVFWLMVTVYLSLRLLEKPTWPNYLSFGLVWGLAIATKVTALTFLVMPLTVNLFFYFKNYRLHLKLLAGCLLALALFLIFSPFVWLDYSSFRESMVYESGVASGKIKVVYTLQFAHTWPYLFQIKNFGWQLGPMIFPALAAVGWLAFSILRRPHRPWLVVFIFPTLYFLYFGSWYTKFIRYMVPVLPFLTLATAGILLAVEKKWRRFGRLLTGATLVLTALWALAFMSIYTHETTRVSASKWIYQNIPSPSKILTEHWDDGLPLNLPDKSPTRYQIEPLTIYEPYNQQKVDYYATKLAQADYLVINSRRLYGTLINLPKEYPVTSRYYRLLFSGQLGYQMAAEFKDYPRFLNWEINDDSSEETFQVYDHPRVLIFKNQAKFSRSALRQILSQENLNR